MDMHALLNALSDAGRNTRSQYHVCLGQLAALCRENSDGLVYVNGSGGLGSENSYRGYYEDLAFAPIGNPTKAADLLAAIEAATTGTYKGYKGGDYTYGEDTPLWVASYGDCGQAIVSVEARDGDLHLTTKDID